MSEALPLTVPTLCLSFGTSECISTLWREDIVSEALQGMEPPCFCSVLCVFWMHSGAGCDLGVQGPLQQDTCLKSLLLKGFLGTQVSGGLSLVSETTLVCLHCTSTSKATGTQTPRNKSAHLFLLENMMLKLKLQYLGPLMGRVDSLEKTWMLGKD